MQQCDSNLHPRAYTCKCRRRCGRGGLTAGYFYTIFCYQQFFFFFFFTHTTNIQKKQNKNRHILNISRFNQKGGEREGQQEHKSYSFNNHVYSTKNTAKPQWLKAWPHRLAPLYIHMRQFAGGYGSNISTHVWCKPVLNYCLLHSCKTSKQHSLLH